MFKYKKEIARSREIRGDRRLLKVWDIICFWKKPTFLEVYEMPVVPDGELFDYEFEDIHPYKVRISIKPHDFSISTLFNCWISRDMPLPPFVGMGITLTDDELNQLSSQMEDYQDDYVTVQIRKGQYNIKSYEIVNKIHVDNENNIYVFLYIK